VREGIKALGLAVVIVLLLGAAVIAYAVATGLDARAQPGRLETRLARTVRSIAIPSAIKERRNPVRPTPEILVEGMSHFADHCASCHANDGSGDTDMGRGLFPKAPDMRLTATQSLSDGELFYIIEHGVRFTGMPGWSTGTTAGEESTWHLVNFIRHLPMLTPAEIEQMQQLNPRSSAEIRQEIEEEKFLRGGGDSTPSRPGTHEHTGGHK
jgi:mono/diheme cytochrome c family protein